MQDKTARTREIMRNASDGSLRACRDSYAALAHRPESRAACLAVVALADAELRRRAA